MNLCYSQIGPDGDQAAQVVWIELFCVDVHCTLIILWTWVEVDKVSSANTSLWFMIVTGWYKVTIS